MNGLYLLILLNVSAVSMQNETIKGKQPQERRWITIPPSLGTANVTVYLGYANNPFGPSIRFQHEKGKFNDSTKQLLKYHRNQSSRFGEEEQNFVDTGQTMIKKESRPKRGVIHLYNMVSCATGCNPLSYKGYGCYCGFLGSGYPVDGIDRCCKIHDWCYDATNCLAFLQYIVPYYWKCYHNRPLCAIEHGEWGGSGSCAQRLCECDKMLSECLRRYPCPSSRALCRSSPLRLLQNAFMIF